MLTSPISSLPQLDSAKTNDGEDCELFVPVSRKGKEDVRSEQGTQHVTASNFAIWGLVRDIQHPTELCMAKVSYQGKRRSILALLMYQHRFHEF